MFSIYVNDLLKASKFETRLYADDTASSGIDLNELNKNVYIELIKVESWLNSIKLSLNYFKTKKLLIKPCNNRINYNDLNVFVRGIKLDRFSSTKYLELILDKDLSWKPHIQYLQKKLSQSVGIIAKIKNYLNVKNLISL